MREVALAALVAAAVAGPACAAGAALELRGSGVQIYVCAQLAAGLAWNGLGAVCTNLCAWCRAILARYSGFRSRPRPIC